MKTELSSEARIRFPKRNGEEQLSAGTVEGCVSFSDKRKWR